MTVYIDDTRTPYMRMIMSHMIADSTAELLAMADAVDLTHPRRLQKAGTPEEHVDICQSKKALALDRGAVEITRREYVRKIRARRLNAMEGMP